MSEENGLDLYRDRETKDKSLDATFRTNDSLIYEDLPPEAFELLDDVEQGKHERNLDWILKERGIDSETLLAWKQCAPYRNALARARTSAIDKPEQSRAYAKGNALRVMRTIVDRARDSKAKDSQRAGETVLEIAGVITKHEVSTTSDVMLEFKRKIMTERGEMTVTERMTVSETHDTETRQS